MRLRVLLVILGLSLFIFCVGFHNIKIEKRVLHWGTLSPFPSEFNPIFISTGGGVTITRFIFEPLFDVVGDKYEPNLVTKWELIDKGKRCRLYLRQGVLFHDGREMTADDVIFSFNLLRKAARGHCGIEKRLAQIEKFQKIDKYCLDVVYVKPVSHPGFSALSFPILPKHLYFDPKQKDYVKYHPVGNGPYVFKGFISRRKVILKANPYYFRGKPKIATIEMTSYNSKLELFNAILRGQIDIALFMPASTYNAISHLENVRVIKQVLDYYYAILYNLNDFAFSEERVRKAIAMSVKWDEFSSLNCFGKKADGPFEMRYFSETGYKLRYNPEKASEFLKIAGWKKQGNFWYKQGHVLEVKLFVPKVYTYDQRWLMLLRQQLNKAGIKLVLRNKEHDVNAYLVMLYGGRNLKEIIFWWFLLKCKDRIVAGMHFLPTKVLSMLDRVVNDQDNMKLVRNIYRQLYYKQLVWFLFYPIVYHVVSKDIECSSPDCSDLLLNVKQGLLSVHWKK